MIKLLMSRGAKFIIILLTLLVAFIIILLASGVDPSSFIFFGVPAFFGRRIW